MGGEDAADPPGSSPLLRPGPGGPGLSWKGIDFYPGPDPAAYARRRAEAAPLPPRTLLFVPSIGTGHGLAELLSRLPAGSAILCIEAFPEIMATALAGAGLPRDPRLLIVRTDRVEGAAAALQALDARRFRGVVRVALSAGYRLAPALYDRLQAALAEGVRRAWQNRVTLMAMGSLQVRNVVANLASLAGAADFAALRSEAPAVVAGAGPSLDAVLPLLSRVKGRCLLVAVDTALPSLRAAGLVPDLVVALEAQVANLQDFVGYDGARSLLACDLSSHPAGPRLFAGRTAFFSSSFAPLGLFDRLSGRGLLPFQFPALGSVGVAAAHAALLLTTGDVYLAGLDFAYTASRTHARGTPFHLAMLRRCTRCLPVGSDAQAAVATRRVTVQAAKNGARVITDSLLGSYRDTLAARISQEPSRVIDMDGAGLPLGAATVSPGEAVDRLAAGPACTELAVPPARQGAADDVRACLDAERALLDRALAALADPAAAARAPWATLEELLHEVDYAWAHFPEYPESAPGSAPFLARVRVAAAWYRQRLDRVAALLEGGATRPRS